jgi:hypothetical protein
VKQIGANLYGTDHQSRIICDYPTSSFLADTHLQGINGLDYTYKNHCLEQIMDLQHRNGGQPGNGH